MDITEHWRLQQYGINISMNKLSLLYLLIFGCSLGVAAQVDSSGLEERRDIMFQELLFEAYTARATENPRKQIESLKKAMAINDQEAIVHYELSKVLAEEGETEEALHFAYKAAELDPENYWVVKHFSRMLQINEMWEDLLIVLEELQRMSPHDITYELQISETYASMGEFKKAIKILNAIEKDQGVVPDLAERKKNIWLAANKPKRAEKEMKKLVKAYPDIPEFWGVLANFYRANGKINDAIDAYKELLRINPEEPRAHFALAEIYRSKQNVDLFFYHLKQAMRSPDVEESVRLDVIISILNASIQTPQLHENLEDMLEYAEKHHPNSAKVQALKGDYFVASGKIDKGLAAYEKAISLPMGNRKEIYLQIIRINLEKRQFDKAAAYGLEALDLYPNQNEVHLFTGIALLESKQYEKAAEVMEAGLEITFGNPELKNEFRKLLGEAHHRVKNYEQSDAHFEMYLKFNPDDELILNNYAYYLSLRKEKLDMALEMTEKSNEISKNNPIYLDTWAWVLYQRGEYKKAREIMERVIDLGGGKDAEVREHYGDILQALGEHERAVEQWKKAISLGGDKEQLEPKINP
jgi:tetratricopeptide (TPR) repeat protein